MNIMILKGSCTKLLPALILILYVPCMTSCRSHSTMIRTAELQDTWGEFADNRVTAQKNVTQNTFTATDSDVVGVAVVTPKDTLDNLPRGYSLALSGANGSPQVIVTHLSDGALEIKSLSSRVHRESSTSYNAKTTDSIGVSRAEINTMGLKSDTERRIIAESSTINAASWLLYGLLAVTVLLLLKIALKVC